MRRRSGHVRLIAVGIFAFGLALGAQAAPEMFEASFIFHAWGSDISSGTAVPYSTNNWDAAPLGYDCQHAEPYTTNGALASRYCTPWVLRIGYPAKGAWSRSLITTGTPPRITMQQSDIAVSVTGFLNTFPPYIQSNTYATFVNAAGSFFAGGGAAADVGYVNKSPANPATAGTWRIRAGKNAFGGVMGLLGKYGAKGQFSITGAPSISVGTASWNMVKAIGRPLFNTIIGYGTGGAPLYQNPYTVTGRWYRTTPKGKVKVSTNVAIGSATLWTTGQVGAFAKTGPYWTSHWRTGYDNRTPGGLGNIQLVTPTLTHWHSPAWNTHTAQIGMLKIQVPEPGAVLLLAAGAGVLVVVRWMRQRK